MKGVTIARATREHVRAVLDIANRAAEETVANFATEPEPLAMWLAAFDETQATHPWLVALEGGDVLGFAKASPHRARGAYAWTAEVTVYIAPEAHGRGLGKALYTRLVALLRAQGYVTLVAGIAVPNAASERLHESFGFTRCATFHRVGWKAGRWHDVGYWELALRGAGEPLPLATVDDVWELPAPPSP